ncbi:PIN domain-containing protein [Candidatus Microgenomates bacterium]|nr:PIN domain-containing protein [Candidatus Microgenomates bacterium]
MKVYLLDTNSILRFFLQDIRAQYEQTKTLIAQAKQGNVKVIVPGVVIPELVYALEKYYAFSRKETAEVILALVKSSYVEIDDKFLYRSALNLYKEVNIDFVDCYVICKAKVEEATLFTFDKKLQKLAQQ